MSDSVYKSPNAELGELAMDDAPTETLKKIKTGWVTAIVSGVLTLGVMIVAVTTDSMGGLYNLWTSVDVLLIFALAFGIYKKSRTAATMMFLYFLGSKIWFIVETGKPNGIVVSLLFIYLYFQGMMGTYEYHKWLSSKK